MFDTLFRVISQVSVRLVHMCRELQLTFPAPPALFPISHARVYYMVGCGIRLSPTYIGVDVLVSRLSGTDGSV